MDISDGKRDLGLDVARGVAVLLMFVAQTAPGDGPLKVLQLSEYVPPPLFALLIGMTAMSAWSDGVRWYAYLVWGGALVAIGLLLGPVPSQIVGVLTYLGALVLLTGVLVRLSAWALSAIVAVLLVTEPMLKKAAYSWWFDHLNSLRESWGGRRVLDLVDLLAAGPFYRLTALAIYACVGILLIRLVKGPRAHTLVAGVAFLLAAVGYLSDKLGGPQLHPYSGTHQVLLFNVCAVVAICEACRLLSYRRPALVVPLADIGRMWLTMYILMVLATATYLQLAPAGSRDDHWSVLGGLVVGAFALAVTWVRMFRDTPFAEGPVEGLLDLVGRREQLVPGSEPADERDDQSLRSRT
jgi:hypothetical protein